MRSTPDLKSQCPVVRALAFWVNIVLCCGEWVKFGWGPAISTGIATQWMGMGK